MASLFASKKDIKSHQTLELKTELLTCRNNSKLILEHLPSQRINPSDILGFEKSLISANTIPSTESLRLRKESISSLASHFQLDYVKNYPQKLVWLYPILMLWRLFYWNMRIQSRSIDLSHQLNDKETNTHRFNVNVL